MSPTSAAPALHWTKCTTTFISTLPALDFPFETEPDLLASARTVLRLGTKTPFYAFLWCYLRREAKGKWSAFDVSSLSEARVRAMPLVLVRLSQWFRFRNSRPRSVERQLRHLWMLLSWADAPQNAGRFEALLSDPDLALEALRGYHSYMRNRLQSHQITSATAGNRDQDAIACLSEIHGRVYKDYIEPLQATKGSGTEAPSSQAVQEFASTLQAIFDSAAAMLLGDTAKDWTGLPTEWRLLRVSASDDSKVVKLKETYSQPRLMELACVAFAGLSFVDSGANLAVLQLYEEPEDLEEQLAQPDRISLKQKAVKFRAGGKLVEVHLSATTVTRLRTYLRVRQALVASLDGADIAPMFIQCAYANQRGEPIAVRALDKNFLTHLRRKITATGASLPKVTLRQLRAYKQQDLVRRVPVEVAAKVMNHSVPTAIQAYCKSQEGVRRGEMSAYLGSLQQTVLAASERLSERPAQVIPTGACAEHGKPSPSDSAKVVQPDCSKVEGCFFCDNYRVHADDQDVRKLLSCRRVLKYILPLSGDSIKAERVYNAVVDRIDALLGEIKHHQLEAYEAARVDVDERGQLTRYWTNKLQQLHLLGMLPTT